MKHYRPVDVEATQYWNKHVGHIARAICGRAVFGGDTASRVVVSKKTGQWNIECPDCLVLLDLWKEAPESRTEMGRYKPITEQRWNAFLKQREDLLKVYHLYWEVEWYAQRVYLPRYYNEASRVAWSWIGNRLKERQGQTVFKDDFVAPTEEME